MTTVESRCRDCLYLEEFHAPAMPDCVATCAIQGNLNSMFFSAEELEAERHPQGICEPGEMLPREAVCYAYQQRGVPIKTLATHRREEMGLIRQAWWILRLHNPIFS